MENNKYFIPDIEDLCIGYECEYNFAKAYKYEFDFVKIGYKDDEGYTNELTNMIHLIDDGAAAIRVPYLTKEQIEAEGWELIQIYPKGACIFQKGTKEKGYELTYDFQEHKIHFTKLYFYNLDDEYTRTKLTWNSLECKDINAFRKICKLLGI